MSLVRRWITLLLIVSLVSIGFVLLGLPTPLLFGGLVGALVYALARPSAPLKLPSTWFQVGQAVVGVVVGTSVEWSSLVALGPSWLLVLVVSCFSLVVSVLSGRLLLRHGVSPVTATFSAIAGGAAGLTAMAQDLGADSRVVAILQYLRLLVVLMTLPLVVAVVFGARAASVAAGSTVGNWQVDVPFVAIAVAGGLLIGKKLHFPSSAILGPLAVAALLTLIPYFHHASVPGIVEAAGYLAIGVQVGLQFTVASIKAIGRMVPTALITIAITLVACAGLGWVLTLTTDASPLDAYLATTPGGIYAVLGTAAATGGDVTFVAAAQVLRLLIVLASAPFVAAYLQRFGRDEGQAQPDP